MLTCSQWSSLAYYLCNIITSHSCHHSNSIYLYLYLSSVLNNQTRATETPTSSQMKEIHIQSFTKDAIFTRSQHKKAPKIQLFHKNTNFHKDMQSLSVYLVINPISESKIYSNSINCNERIRFQNVWNWVNLSELH